MPKYITVKLTTDQHEQLSKLVFRAWQDGYENQNAKAFWQRLIKTLAKAKIS